MNFSFEGNYKPRRQINLGGIKKVEDKKSLMLKAQAERKARELDRQKLKSAQQIQAFYRGRKEAYLIRQKIKNEFKQQLHTNNLMTLTRQLLLFYSKYRDNDLADQYNNLLAAQLSNMFQLKTEALDSWIWLTCLLIKKVLLPSMETSLVSSGHILSRLFDATTYPNDEIRIRIITFAIYNTTLFTSVKNTIMSQPLLKPDMEAVLLQLSLFYPPYYYPTSQLIETYQQKRPQSMYVTRDVLVQKLILEVLTEPFLLDALTHSVTTQLVVQLPLKSVLENILQLSQHKLENYAIAGLLMNVTEMADIGNGKYLDSALTLYAEAIQILLSRLPISYLTDPHVSEDSVMQESDTDSSDDDENDNDEDHDVVMKEVVPIETVSPMIRERLERLYNSDRVNQLLFQYMQLATTDSSAIQSISSFFNTIMLRWPMKKDAILNTLLYKSQNTRELMQVLWHAWSKSTPYTLFNEDMHIMARLPETVTCITQHVESWSVLYLLCEVYARLLLTMGDEEFLDKKGTHSNPLDLQQVVTLSRQLKDISFVMFWRANSMDLSQTIGLTGIQLNQLRSSVTYLLQQLHMRDSRRHFCPADHWLIPDLKTDTFSTEAVAEEFNLESEQQEQQQQKRPLRMVSKGRLAIISPRLGLLNNIPFVIPFEQRVEIFRMFVENDKKRSQRSEDFFGRSKLGITVRRDHIFEDGFTSLHALGADLKNRIAISFVDEFGLEEAGIDGGGVFKEFLTGLSKEAFNKNYGLFTTTTEQLLYPNPTLRATKAEQLEHFNFLGLIIGKAVYEGILLDVAFAEFFLKKCLGQVNYLDDLSSLDPDLYKGLLAVKNFDGNVEDLSLDFTSTHIENGRSITVDLIPRGSQTPVTNQNRIQYIYSIANYRLNTQIAKQCRAFFKGLSTIIDIKWLRMFNQQELQILLGGASVPIDLHDLRQHTVLAGYMDHDPTIKNFWRALESFDNDLRMKFVKFVTSCSRPPLLGFKELVPKFCLRNAGVNDERLPTSSTCVNLLKLPNYSNYQILKEKLVYAITADAGFDLS